MTHWLGSAYAGQQAIEQVFRGLKQKGLAETLGLQQFCSTPRG